MDLQGNGHPLLLVRDAPNYSQNASVPCLIPKLSHCPPQRALGLAREVDTVLCVAPPSRSPPEAALGTCPVWGEWAVGSRVRLHSLRHFP